MTRLAAALTVLAVCAQAHAGGDFAVASSEWNGLSRLAAEIEAAGCSVNTGERLEWSELEGRDVLWFVFPRAPLDADKLRRFLAAGGHAVIADDFGSGEAAFAALSLRRVATPRAGDFYDANPQLPIARAELKTALGRAAPFIVGNHAAAFETTLPATFAFSARSALVVEGHYGQGSFVAIADASVLINNMLDIEENAAFVRRLAAQSCAQRGQRITIFSHGFTSAGEPPRTLPRFDDASPSGRLFARVSDGVREANGAVARALADAAARAVVAAFVALVVGVLLWLGFPRRRRLDDKFARLTLPGALDPLGVLGASGGFVDYGGALSVLRDEAVARLSTILPGVAVDKLTVDALLAQLPRRLPPAGVAAWVALWRALSALRWRRVEGEIIADEPVTRGRLVVLHGLASTAFALAGNSEQSTMSQPVQRAHGHL